MRGNRNTFHYDRSLIKAAYMFLFIKYLNFFAGYPFLYYQTIDQISVRVHLL
jgi:hypothetical protein